VQTWFICCSAINDKRIDAYSNESGYFYPEKGKEAPPFGRIVAIVDFYDALFSRKTYKNSWKDCGIINEIKKCSDTCFDPDVVSIFLPATIC
jgi:response regulator RpfG family c-di-GMP phosphodiesterase